MRQREIRAEQKAESQMTGMGRAALLGADDFLQAPGGVLDLVESDEPEGTSSRPPTPPRPACNVWSLHALCCCYQEEGSTEIGWGR